MSDALAARLDESIAAQKLEKARWYFKQGDDVSARFTLNRLRRSHPRTVAATIAYDLLLERGWVKDQSAEPAKPTNPAAPESPSEPPKPDAPHADPAPDSKKEGAQ